MTLQSCVNDDGFGRVDVLKVWPGLRFCGRPATRKTVTVGYLACSGCRALLSREGKRAVGSFGKGSRRKRRPALSLSLSFWVGGGGKEALVSFLGADGRPSAKV